MLNLEAGNSHSGTTASQRVNRTAEQPEALHWGYILRGRNTGEGWGWHLDSRDPGPAKCGLLQKLRYETVTAGQTIFVLLPTHEITMPKTSPLDQIYES